MKKNEWDEENEWDDDSKKKYNIEALTIVDDGDYQGTQIFIIPEDTYQPSVEQYIYTKAYYGSCSLCDTLQGIFDYCDYEDKPNEKQVADLMTLCLHLLQNFKKMSE